MYAAMKEETVWSFDRLQSYIDETYATEKGLPENWVYTAFTVGPSTRISLSSSPISASPRQLEILG